MHSTTYGGHPVACAVAVEVLNILEEEKILENMESQYLKDKMAEALGGHKNVGEIRSIGLINALELVEDRESKKGFDPAARIGWQIGREALKRGLFIRPIGDLLYFNPPLTITRQEIDKAVRLLKESVEEVLGK